MSAAAVKLRWERVPPPLRSLKAFYAAAALIGLALLFSFHQVVAGSVERVALERQAAKQGGTAVVSVVANKETP